MTYIYLGNLNANDIQKRLGVEFPADVIEQLTATNVQKATNIPAGMWHCFDIPFEILCGDMETAQKINNMLKPLEHKFNRVISIGITPSSEDE